MANSASTVFLSDGALGEVGNVLAQLNCTRIFLVIDCDAYQASGAKAELEPILANYAVSRFIGFEQNPKLEDVQRGIEQLRIAQPEIVIALGGGTAIDLGKLIGTLADQSAPARDLVVGQSPIETPGLPLIAIPTTAGTGSEATHFAVVYVENKKHSVAHQCFLPAYAIVDSRLTHSMPPSITASTGLDALCQAIESYWALAATEESTSYAREAIQLAWENLLPSVVRPTEKSRRAMCRASHLAGKAINISKTTAPHALSYHLTSVYNIPHGVAVATVLSPIFKYNAEVTNNDCADPRGAEYVRNKIAAIVDLLGAATVQEACLQFSQLLSAIDCPNSLAQAGVRTDEQIGRVVDAVNLQRLSNNPRRCTPSSLLELFSSDSKTWT